MIEVIPEKKKKIIIEENKKNSGLKSNSLYNFLYRSIINFNHFI
jgi:hypothetical protein